MSGRESWLDIKGPARLPPPGRGTLLMGELEGFAPSGRLADHDAMDAPSR
jgi:hypothetical protein